MLFGLRNVLQNNNLLGPAHIVMSNEYRSELLEPCIQSSHSVDFTDSYNLLLRPGPSALVEP